MVRLRVRSDSNVNVSNLNQHRAAELPQPRFIPVLSQVKFDIVGRE